MSLEGYIIFSIIGLVILYRHLKSLDKKKLLNEEKMSVVLKKLRIASKYRTDIFGNVIAILVVLVAAGFLIYGIYTSITTPFDPNDYPGEDYPVNAWDR